MQLRAPGWSQKGIGADRHLGCERASRRKEVTLVSNPHPPHSPPTNITNGREMDFSKGVRKCDRIVSSKGGCDFRIPGCTGKQHLPHPTTPETARRPAQYPRGISLQRAQCGRRTKENFAEHGGGGRQVAQRPTFTIGRNVIPSYV